MRELKAFVPGLPAPQGSKSPKGTYTDKQGRTRVRMVESSEKVAPWREDVRNAFAPGGVPKDRFPGAVTLYLEFVLTRPKRLGQYKNEPHVVKPDLDKLVRSTKDALASAGVLTDDCTVVSLDGCSKRYADYGEPTGAFIRVADPFPEFVKPQPKQKKGKPDGQKDKQQREPRSRAAAAGHGGGVAPGRGRSKGRRGGAGGLTNPFC